MQNYLRVYQYFNIQQCIICIMVKKLIFSQFSFYWHHDMYRKFRISVHVHEEALTGIIQRMIFMKKICTIVHSETRRSWFYILIGYNSLTNDTIRKSMGCFKKFRKFPIWWTLRFSNLVKGELRKLSLKILTWFLKVCFLSHITVVLIFLGE